MTTEIKERLRVYLKDHKEESFQPKDLLEVSGIDIGMTYKLLLEMAGSKLLKKVFPEKTNRVYFQYW